MRRIRVLQIVPSLSQVNGVASYSVNYYKNMKNIDMDFVMANLNTNSNYINELVNLGASIIDLSKSNSKNMFDYIIKIKKFFKQNAKSYDIIHCNVSNSGAIFLYYAWKYGIKVRILHSHATATGDSVLKKIRNDMILPITKLFANTYFACSKAAGKNMFKNKKFTIINNAIDSNKYLFNENLRKEIRNEYNLKNKIVLGNVGRLVNQKNQKFLIEIYSKLLLKNKNYVMIIVGNGPLEQELKKSVKEKSLDDKIIFAGSRIDTNKIYNAFDVLLLPSLYEGLPVVGIEAQCNGVTCIFSDRITKEVKINDNVYFLPIDNSDKWVKKIINLDFKRIKNNKFNESHFNIENECINLEKIYYKLFDEYERKN